jgi:hypothetical protein
MKIVVRMSMLGLVLIITTLFISLPSEAETGLLKNPGFESEVNKTTDWDIWTGERLNEYKHSGDWSLHGWGFDGNGDTGAWQGISVTPGTKVEFKGYLMSPGEVGVPHKDPLKGGAEAYLEIEWYKGGTKLSSITSTKLTGASDWKLYSVSGVAPEGADSSRIVAKVKSVPGSSGDVYFDDLKATAASDLL